MSDGDLSETGEPELAPSSSRRVLSSLNTRGPGSGYEELDREPLSPTATFRKRADTLRENDISSSSAPTSPRQQRAMTPQQLQPPTPAAAQESFKEQEYSSPLEDRKTALMEADVDMITTELRKTFYSVHRKKGSTHLRHDAGEPVLMLEMTSEGVNSFKQMQLRELLDYVNNLAKETDQKHGGFGFPPCGYGARDVNANASSLASTAIAESAYCSAANPLRLRDLRRLESNLNVAMGSDSTILVRWHCVLFALDPIQALIMNDRLILIVPDGADSLLSIIEDHILEWVDEFITKELPPSQTITPKESFQDLPAEAGAAAAASQGREGKKYKEKEKEKVEAKDVSTSDIHLAGTTAGGGSADGWTPPLSPSSKMQALGEAYVPFEMHAYDTLLTTVASLQNQEYIRTNNEVQGILTQFQQKGCILSIDAQEKMRKLKNHVSHMTNRLNSFERALDDIVENDEDMALMNLSLLRNKPTMYKYPLVKELVGTHEEVEELLENYLNDYKSIEAKLEYLKAQMQSAEELVSLRLDTARNQLLVANTAFAVLACSIASGSYVTGAFGMNLDNTTKLQYEPGVFNLVFIMTAVGIVIVFYVIIWYLRYTGILPTSVDTVKQKEL